jgi:predicted metal-binding membrane protein
MTHESADPEPEKPPMPADGGRLTAAFIATKIRDVGLECEVVNLEPVETVVLKRDRIIVILAVAFLTASVWSHLLWLSTDMSMGGMDMTGLRMIPSGMGLMMLADMPWQTLEFAFVFAMWTVMMVGMMTPSAAPMFLMYARVGRQTQAQSRPLTATVWFAIGYFLVWMVFSLFATLVQWALERFARFHNGNHEQHARRVRIRDRGPVSMDPT